MYALPATLLPAPKPPCQPSCGRPAIAPWPLRWLAAGRPGVENGAPLNL